MSFFGLLRPKSPSAEPPSGAPPAQKAPARPRAVSAPPRNDDGASPPGIQVTDAGEVSPTTNSSYLFVPARSPPIGSGPLPSAGADDPNRLSPSVSPNKLSPRQRPKSVNITSLGDDGDADILDDPLLFIRSRMLPYPEGMRPFNPFDIRGCPNVSEVKFSATLPPTQSVHKTKIVRTVATWNNLPDEDLVCDCEQSSERLKKAIRDGIPDGYREHVWAAITGTGRSPDDVERLYSSSRARNIPETRELVTEQVSYFGGSVRTRLCLNDEGLAKVHEVLYLLVCDHADIAYAPHIPAVAVVLMHYMPEANVYESCSNMIQQSKRRRHYVGINRHQMALLVLTFGDVIQKHVYRVHQIMTTLGVDVADFAPQWLHSLFFGFLPFQTALRVFDCFLCEGNKAVFRVALGILKLYTDSLRRASTREHFLHILNMEVTNCWDADALLEAAFAIPLKRAAILTMASKHRANVLHDDQQLMSVYAPVSSLPSPRPVHAVQSEQVTEEMLTIVWSWLPERYQGSRGSLVYASDTDGYSLITMRDASKGHAPMVILITTNTGAIFGAYLTADFDFTENFTGSGQSFVFSLKPYRDVYRWVKGTSENSYFVLSQPKSLYIGGGSTGSAIRIDDTLEGLRVVTSPCKTFNNPPLSETTENMMVVSIEIFTMG